MRPLRASILFALILISPASSLLAGEIHEAVTAGNLDRVTELLRSDPALVRSPSEAGCAELPLHLAAMQGQVEIARLLLQSGADIDGFDRDESTPLHVAALHRKSEMVRFLLDQGADVNRRDKNGAYALSFAISGGDPTAIQMILDAGADLNHVSPQGGTLLPSACMRGLWDLVDLLLERGVDINQGDRNGTTPMHWVAYRDDAARVAEMLRRGAKASAADSNGMVPLHAAAERGALGTAKALLDAGADPNAANRLGMTPLMYASIPHGANPEMIRLLVSRGADPNKSSARFNAPLSVAAQRGNADIAAALLDGGADPMPSGGYNQQTPLHVASILGKAELVRVLTDHGAELNAKDASGATPLDLAVRYGHQSVASLLGGRGAQGAPWGGASGSGLASAGRPPAGDATIWHLGHSGWGVKTREHFLVFDYFDQDNLPDSPGLCNGYIDPREIAGEDVTVFVSHEHADHYDPVIYEWREQVPEITYVLGFRPPQPPPCPVEQISPHETRMIDGMTVTTIRSNDSGVGYLIEVDGLLILHAGDHANRNRDLSGDYTPEIAYLETRGARPDIAFLPVTGCNFGDQVAVKIGTEYALDRLKPLLFVPMHGGQFNPTYRDFVRDVRDRHARVRMEHAEVRGDRIQFSKMRAS